MADTLVIRLASRPEVPASWLLVDASGGRLSAVQSGPLSLAAPLAIGRRVIALVPGIEVLHAQPELPVRGGARLLQVVPFALEEHVADEVEGLHFALGKPDPAKTGTPVAAVRRDRFLEWLEQLRAAQISPAAVFADSATVPGNPGQVVLLIDEDQLYVRRAGEPPLTLDIDPLREALEFAALTAESHALLYVTQADWQTHQATIDALRERLAGLKVQLLPDGPLPLLAHQAVSEPPFNLLQGEFAVRSKSSDQWRAWRVAAILAACLFALNLLGKGVEIWHLKNTEKALDSSIEAAFHEAMPGEQNAVDARRRMEARLAAIHGAGNGKTGNLLEILGTLGEAVAKVPQTSLEAFSFRGSVLDLRVGARDVNSLDQLRSVVTERGLQAELQSSNARDSGVEGRIQIKGRGAT
ncbi:MAG TPA: type II secretion system protein GspL [Steroidobacteraceae bacterium]|nr:type II secretion system protein GspL [Steroidobacteraceae bacterium]